jgi:glycosyltransferase involved in cell wall biosynthesis
MPEPPLLPPLTDAPLSLILLARDDAEHLHDVVLSWQTVLNGLNRPFEVIVVDDGSRDGTPFLAGGLPGVRLLGLARRRGEGAALRLGLAAAQHPVIACAPCDRQYRPEDLPTLLQELDKVHLVSGFRVWQPMPWPLRILGWTYRMLLRVVLADRRERLPGWLGWNDYLLWLGCRLVFGLRIHDVRCAFRVFRREVVAHVPIQSESWFAHVEVLAKANFVGDVMADVPVPHIPRVRPAAEDEAERRQAWADFSRLWDDPDFGSSDPTQATIS